MCVFELTHFLPLLVIALTYVSSYRFTFSGSAVVVASAIIGLVAGQHVHTEHFVEYSMLDACSLYAVALIASGVRFAQLTINKLTANA